MLPVPIILDSEDSDILVPKKVSFYQRSCWTWSSECNLAILNFQCHWNNDKKREILYGLRWLILIIKGVPLERQKHAENADIVWVCLLILLILFMENHIYLIEAKLLVAWMTQEWGLGLFWEAKSHIHLSGYLWEKWIWNA